MSQLRRALIVLVLLTALPLSAGCRMFPQRPQADQTNEEAGDGIDLEPPSGLPSLEEIKKGLSPSQRGRAVEQHLGY